MRTGAPFKTIHDVTKATAPPDAVKRLSNLLKGTADKQSAGRELPAPLVNEIPLFPVRLSQESSELGSPVSLCGFRNSSKRPPE